MPVQPGGVDRDGAMALPASAKRLAWYRFGPSPWAQHGAAVLAGHVDTVSEGPGPLVRIAGVRRGEQLSVRSGTRKRTYVVVSVTRVAKSALNLPGLFSRTGPPRLHLVTCGGEYLPDRGGYQDNVVVTARVLQRR